MGFRTKHMRPDVIARHAFLSYCIDDKETLCGVNGQTYREKLHRIDPILEAPVEYVMAGRVALLLRGTGRHKSSLIRSMTMLIAFQEWVTR